MHVLKQTETRKKHAILLLLLLLLSHRLDSARSDLNLEFSSLKWFTLPPLYLHIMNVSIYRQMLIYQIAFVWN